MCCFQHHQSYVHLTPIASTFVVQLVQHLRYVVVAVVAHNVMVRAFE